MGSTSGTRAGDSDNAPAARFGDTIPVAAPTASMTERKHKSYERTKSRGVFKHRQSAVNRWAEVDATFALAVAGTLVFDCGGLGFVLLMLQILSFLPPDLHRTNVQCTGTTARGTAIFKMIFDR